MIDIAKLTLSELIELERVIPREIRRRKAEERQNVRKEVEAFVKSRGYSLEELLPVSPTATRRSSGTVAPKYRDPKDPSRTWTGRGRKPKWVEELLAQGKSLSQLEI